MEKRIKRTRKKNSLVMVILLMVFLAGIAWYFLSRNHPPVINAVSIVPAEVLTGRQCRIKVAVSDPDGDNVIIAVTADPPAIPADSGNFSWQAPAVTENGFVTLTTEASDTRGGKTVQTDSVFVFLPGWHGIVDMFLSDTVVTGGQQLSLSFDPPLEGDITYSYDASGGTFDTLASGEVVWRAPRVDRDTTFTVTITAVNEKGEKVIKTIVVSVKTDEDKKDKVRSRHETVEVMSGDTVRAIVPAGKPARYSYQADGGVFDTLSSGEVVWQAPDVDTVTVFTITVTETADDGSRITRTITVTVRPCRDTGEEPVPEDAVTAAPDSIRQRAVAESVVRADSLAREEKLHPAAYTVTGRVTDTDGKPMPGVVVTTGDDSLVSGDDGTYRVGPIDRKQKTVITYTIERYVPETREYGAPAGTRTEVTGNVIMRLLALTPPTQLEARTVPDTVYLSWQGGAAQYLYGYNIYRSVSEYSGYARMNTKPLAFEKFTDTAVRDSIPYFYKVSSVNVDDVEGDLSDPIRVIVPIKLFAVQSVYDSPGSNPSAIAYDGKDIWTSDNLKGEIYRHDWDLKAVRTYKAPGANPTGLAWDGSHMWSCDYKKKYIYKHGTDMKVVAKYKGPGYQVTDLAWDGTHLWAANSEGKLFKMTTDGKVVREYKSPFSLYTGITWDGKNIWICSIHTKKIYRLNAAMEIDDSYESPHLLSNGFAWDGKNLWVCGKVTEKIYKFAVD